MSTGRYLPIEDHGLIGDLLTTALVGIDGSIDFFCAPEFDSPTVFASLLDADRGGRFELTPRFEVGRVRQMYLPDTNVLVTKFLAEQGIVEVTDFMPVVGLGYPQAIIRMVRAIRGAVAVDLHVRPGFDYARADHQVEERGDHVLFSSRGDDRLAFRLWSSMPSRVEDGAVRARLDLEPGREEWFVFERVAERDDAPIDRAEGVRAAFEATVNYWRDWVARSRYHGRWREELLRAALALKLLISERHGAMVAAATFGLPEAVGGERNWDYRYVWPRDASFALRALAAIGFDEETDRFIEWLEPVCRLRQGPEGPPLDVMYRIDGRVDLDELALDHLEGYRGSRPVRVGNDAHRQIQLDIYGELLNALHQHDERGWPIHHDLWFSVAELVDWVCANWRQPDHGIWEIRGRPREFLQSRAMCWVTLDRAVRLAQAKSRPAPVERWTCERDAIYHDIYGRFWSDKLRSFTQYPGADAVDASSLLLPLYGFISPTDPRWLSSLEAIQGRLVEGPFVYRYRIGRAADDGLRGHEGTFTACSFWLIECLARAGFLDRARLLFETMLGYANHLGLYAEQLGPSGEHLGNFPQALTLLALIKAGADLDHRLSAAEHTRRQKGPGD